jgi:hypothetical protein
MARVLARRNLLRLNFAALEVASAGNGKAETLLAMTNNQRKLILYLTYVTIH